MSAVDDVARPLRPLIAIVVALGAGLIAGGIGGWLWWTWWGPAPHGKIYDTNAGPHWYPDPFDPGITRDFSGTAQYVVIGFGLAILVGIVAGIFARNDAMVGLGAVVLACGIAAILMTVLGTWQSPGNPQARAAYVKIGTELPGHLAVTGWTPYLAWPVGGLLGYLVVMLSLNSMSRSDESARPEQRSAEPAPKG